jgi:hypothetical protein
LNTINISTNNPKITNLTIKYTPQLNGLTVVLPACTNASI